MVTLQIPHQNRFGKITPASQHLQGLPSRLSTFKSRVVMAMLNS